MNDWSGQKLFRVRMQSLSTVYILAALFLGPSIASFAQNEHKNIKRPGVRSKATDNKTQLIQSLEKVIPQLMDDAQVHGLSVALIEGGDIVWHKGYGFSNARTKEPVTDATVFDAASLSKPVFAYAVLRLVDRQQLQLDAPLSRYLPYKDIENDSNSNLITVRTVLSHTTGFPNWRRGRPLKINFIPGQRFSYSGEGFEYLQKVVEHVTGSPLNEFIKKEVFGPLGMTSSSYVWETRFDSRKAFGHDIAGGLSQRQQPTDAHAAYSLQTTAYDYAKFIRAVLLGTGLKKQTARAILNSQIKVQDDCINDCFSTDQGRLSSAVSWGLGLGLQHRPEGDLFWHWGDNGEFNFRTYVEASIQRQRGIVILSNSANAFSIVPGIVDRVFSGNHPAFAWVRAFEPYTSPARVLMRAILADGADAALARYRNAKRAGLADKALTERQMNNLGYQLLDANKLKESIEVFKLNVEEFPNSANTYDSLAEAYMVHGDKELAIKNYKRSIELNPNNKTAIEMIKKLEGKN